MPVEFKIQVMILLDLSEPETFKILSTLPNYVLQEEVLGTPLLFVWKDQKTEPDLFHIKPQARCISPAFGVFPFLQKHTKLWFDYALCL